MNPKSNVCFPCASSNIILRNLIAELEKKYGNMNQNIENICKRQHTGTSNGFKLKNLLQRFAKNLIIRLSLYNLHRK